MKTVYEIQFRYDNGIYLTLNPDSVQRDFHYANTIGSFDVSNEFWKKMQKDPRFCDRIIGRAW